MNDNMRWQDIPDVRDGLTDKERIVLVCLNDLKKEMGDRYIPTVMLYGRITEHYPMSVEEMQNILQRFVGKI